MRLDFLIPLSLLCSLAHAGEDFRATIRGDVAHSAANFAGGSTILSAPQTIPPGAQVVFATVYLQSFKLWTLTGNASECGIDRIQRGDFNGMTVQVGSGAPASIQSVPFEQTDCDDFVTPSGGSPIACDVKATQQTFKVDLRSALVPGASIRIAGAPSDLKCATLMVVYCDASRPVCDIRINDDLLLLTHAPATKTAVFEDLLPNANQARLVISHWSAEEGEHVAFNGIDLGQLQNGSSLVGVDSRDISSIVLPTDTRSEFQISATGIDEGCLTVHGVALVVTTDEAEGRVREVGREVVGAGGLAPRLSLAGCPLAGERVDLTVSSGLGGAFGCLAVGQGVSVRPFLCGEAVVPQPLFESAHRLGGIPGLSGAGTASWNFQVPLSAVGLTVSFQVGYLDPAACGGVSISKALVVEMGG